MNFVKKLNNPNGRLIKFMSILSIGLGLIFLIRAGDLFRGIVFAVVAPLLLALPRFAYRKKFFKKYNMHFLETVESFSLPLFILPTLGSLGLYRTKFEYDTLVHFITPVFISILVAFLLSHRSSAPFTKKRLFRLAVATFFAVFFLCILWEVFEFFSDKYLGTGMLAGLNHPLNIDTKWDLAAGALGSLVGSILVFYKWKKWQEQWLK